MSKARIVQSLNEMALFKSLNPKERELLSLVMHEQTFSRGDVICVEGEPGSSCYFIAQGVIDVRKRIGNQQERVITTLREGQLFGHLALVDAGPRTATCVAATTLRLLVLERDDFDTLFNSGTRFAFKFQDVIARTATQQLRLANERLAMIIAEEGDRKGAPATRKSQQNLAALGQVLVDTDTNLKLDPWSRNITKRDGDR